MLLHEITWPLHAEQDANGTGNLTLIKRNALTTEPQLLILDGKIWIIVVYQVEMPKKNCNAEKMLESVVAARQLWCWVQHWRYELGSLMKCVCKVSIYHLPKNQHIIMLLHNCSLPWILSDWGDLLPKELKTWTLCDACLPTIEAILTSGWC